MHSGTRWRYTLLLALLATLFGALAASPASAQDDEGRRRAGSPSSDNSTYEDPDTGEDIAAIGVTIEVEGVGAAD